MRKILILNLVLFGLALACADDTEAESGQQSNTLIGTWRLTEIMADPGDGSGTFTPVTSSRSLTFNKDGSFTCNGDICTFGAQAGNATTGTYTLADSTWQSPFCADPGFKYTFKLNGDTLILNYVCIEPCRAKYLKTNS
jgi:hypothetical protein